MPYPQSIDRFVEKLNKADTVYVIEDEELVLENGVFEGELAHDNVKNDSVMVFTGPNMTGERIQNFFLSIPSDAPWKRIIKVFANVPKVYVTYETIGDQVEAEDINRVQESIVNTQIELERYKSVNDQAVDNLDSRLTTVENNKAEKSYVDSELSKKANKSDTYTKSETNSLIQALIDSAPETLNTFAKIANAINNDPNFATTINNLLAQLEADKLDKSLKGVAGGLAELDSTGHVPSSQLPSYVDDVLEYPSKNNFPDVGETGKIYVALDTNLTYRWSGSAYIEISPSLALGETSSTAYRGDRGKIAYDHSQTIGNPHQTTKADIGLGNIENYGIATQGEAEAGSINNKYMTPLRTKQAIDVLQAVKSVAGKTGNVTLTKDDVGLSNVDNVKQASKTEFDSHNNDTTRHITSAERTAWNNKAEVSQIPTKVSQLENDRGYVTQEELGDAGYGDMLKSIYDQNNNGIVDNAEKLGGQLPSYYQPALGYTPVNKAGDTMTGTLVIDGKNLPSGADIVTLRRGSETNRFVLETQDKGMQAFLEAGASIGLMGTITASDFRIRTNYLDRMSVSGSSGDVGIGTTSPSQKLDVNGKIRMRLQTQASDADDIVATKKYVDTKTAEAIVGPFTWDQLRGVI